MKPCHTHNALVLWHPVGAILIVVYGVLWQTPMIVGLCGTHWEPRIQHSERMHINEPSLDQSECGTHWEPSLWQPMCGTYWEPLYYGQLVAPNGSPLYGSPSHSGICAAPIRIVSLSCIGLGGAPIGSPSYDGL